MSSVTPLCFQLIASQLGSFSALPGIQWQIPENISFEKTSKFTVTLRALSNNHFSKSKSSIERDGHTASFGGDGVYMGCMVDGGCGDGTGME